MFSEGLSWFSVGMLSEDSWRIVMNVYKKAHQKLKELPRSANRKGLNLSVEFVSDLCEKSAPIDSNRRQRKSPFSMIPRWNVSMKELRRFAQSFSYYVISALNNNVLHVMSWRKQRSIRRTKTEVAQIVRSNPSISHVSWVLMEVNITGHWFGKIRLNVTE